MKKSIIIALCALMAGCHQAPVSQQPTDPAEPVAVIPVPTTPPPAAPAVVAPTPEVPPPIAVAFYLASAVSVETPDGLTGLPPGTEIKPVRAGVYSAAGHELTLRPDQVTSDPTLAQRMRAAEARSQAAISRSLAAPAPRVATQTPAPQAQAAPAAPTAPQRAAGPLGNAPQIGAGGALGETGAAKASVTWHTDAQGRQYHNGSYGRVYR